MSDETATTVPAPKRSAIPDLDPVASVFFVSHATARDHNADGPTEPNKVFAEFGRTLSKHLEQLVARRSGADSGFIDRDLRGGVGWERKILSEIGTCQVLVALVSGPFSQSEWCGKEWDAFTRRQTWRRKDGLLMAEPQCALPILWTVGPQDRYPPIVRKRQWFTPRPTSKSELDQLYLSEGIYGMYQAERDAYHATVWRIAQEIQKLVTEYWVEPLIPDDGDCLINVFAEEEA